MIKPGTFYAVAGVTLVGLLPTTAADEAFMGQSYAAKSFNALASICRVEARTESNDPNRTIFIDPGMGDGGFPIATANPKAQAWFNYGIKMFHAFYHDDARRAFDNAVAADPHCAMCLWGQALSRGPTMNFDVEEKDTKAGLEMAKRAQAQARTAREKLLASAMVRRYSGPQGNAAEKDFAAALLKADAMGPSTPDLRLLSAEVTLSEFRRGDHAIVPAAIALIEPILRATPNHTGAIHYYIHATEGLGHAALALPYAERLSALAPNASHLVHMAAHTYFRVGRYEDAATINASAMRTDSDHLTETKTAGGLKDAVYYEHNLTFGMAGTLMSGDRALGLKFADHLHRAFPEKDFEKDNMSEDETRRFVIYARYEPQRMLSLPEPVAAEGPETLSFYHYARGEAFAALGDAKSLAAETEKVTGDSRSVKIARLVLAGRLAMLQHRYSDAGREFEEAVALQDQFAPVAWDPPPWWYPVRRSAAAAWLQAGQFQQSADAVQKSLEKWPNDPLALRILAQAEAGLGRAADARRHDAQAIGLWMGDIGKVEMALM